MSIAKWDDSFKTGYEKVDKQHEQLFGMVNELHDSIVAGHGKEVMAPMLQKLAKYTIEHFRDEEQLMRAIEYPRFEAHKRFHDDLTQQVKDLMERFQEGKLVLSMTLSTFLSNWLQHHIRENDMGLIQYAKEHSKAQMAMK